MASTMRGGGLLGQALALERPELLRSLIIANSLHSPEMWQANHANINAELARQHPDVWDRITALHAAGHRSTDPEMAAEFAAAARLVRFYDPITPRCWPPSRERGTSSCTRCSSGRTWISSSAGRWRGSRTSGRG
jgi:pimeloyl-ACP methyl ester carboxylesterase